MLLFCLAAVLSLSFEETWGWSLLIIGIATIAFFIDPGGAGALIVIALLWNIVMFTFTVFFGLFGPVTWETFKHGVIFWALLMILQVFCYWPLPVLLFGRASSCDHMGNWSTESASETEDHEYSMWEGRARVYENRFFFEDRSHPEYYWAIE